MQPARHTVNFTDSSNEEFKAKIGYSSGQGKTILLIDDEEMVINIIEMMLKEMGYNVLKAHNGYEGLQLFKTNRSEIDLIISDLEMPKMNGKEVLDKLREIDPEIKVMLSSGALTDIDEQVVINNGFNGFLKKPYSLTTLREKMSEAFCPKFQ
ncbi:MAG: response regulator [Desulfobacterales bacterium]|jgi:CheY-like chemotaxis protein